MHQNRSTMPIYYIQSDLVCEICRWISKSQLWTLGVSVFDARCIIFLNTKKTSPKFFWILSIAELILNILSKFQLHEAKDQINHTGFDAVSRIQKWVFQNFAHLYSRRWMRCVHVRRIMCLINNYYLNISFECERMLKCFDALF